MENFYILKILKNFVNSIIFDASYICLFNTNFIRIKCLAHTRFLNAIQSSECFGRYALVYDTINTNNKGRLLHFTDRFSFAKDFGIEGHVFPIIEESILDVIQKRLAKIDIEKLNRDMQEKTKAYVERPAPVSGITKAKDDKISVSYFDPSYTVPDNIYDHNNNLLHAAGKIINPLEHTSLTESLIFIDGDDAEQVETALSIRKQKQDKLKIILVKGSPLKLQREHKVWIYFDQAGFITTKLGIKEVPALVEQDGLRLKITTNGKDGRRS
jgi:conjugal transfer pilus assembly protein TraW